MLERKTRRKLLLAVRVHVELGGTLDFSSLFIFLLFRRFGRRKTFDFDDETNADSEPLSFFVRLCCLVTLLGKLSGAVNV